MPHILVTDRDGSQEQLAFAPGAVLMEVLRARGYDNIPALCGGCCACATCQVYVGEEWLPHLPAIGEEEAEMLAASDTCRNNSRLSCQIALDSAHDGLAVTIAEL